MVVHARNEMAKDKRLPEEIGVERVKKITIVTNRSDTSDHVKFTVDSGFGEATSSGITQHLRIFAHFEDRPYREKFAAGRVLANGAALGRLC